MRIYACQLICSDNKEFDMEEKMGNKKVMQKHMKERLGKVFHPSMYPPLPRSLNIELNNTCNQACVFCPYHGKYAQKKLKPAFLPKDFVKSLLKQAWELGIGKKEVGFYIAGEAFLYPGFAKIIGFAKSLGFPYVFLTTNGALADEVRMKAVIDAGLDSIRFSVNASDAKTYAELHGRDDFDKVLQNIKFMHSYIQSKKCALATSLSCVITKKTRGIESEMIRIFSPYVDDIVFIPVILDRLAKIEELKSIYEVVKDSGAEIDPAWVCPVLFDTMYVNALGRAVPCCAAYDEDVFFADLKLDADMKKAWESEGYRKYRSIFLEQTSDEDTICENCILRKKGVGRLFWEADSGA